MIMKLKFRAFQDGEIVTQPMFGNYAVARFFGFLYEITPGLICHFFAHIQYPGY